MAKDLRNFLEHAQKGTKAGVSAAPLAQRRSLSSPGEPRVYRVKAGYVCGLCGGLHASLEPAFDCLGRCTIELRLRSPAGRSLSGDAGHYACTACGRGYANTDDAEECFERCLAKMKPSRQFEEALRRVQIKYVQRLQQHGLRSLQKIDALAEHTKMLETLTYEQKALGRQNAQPTEKVLHKKTTAPVAKPIPTSSISELSAFNSTEESKSLTAPTLEELSPEEILSSSGHSLQASSELQTPLQEGPTAELALGSTEQAVDQALGDVVQEQSLSGSDFAGTLSSEGEADALLGGGLSDAQPAESADAFLGGGLSDAQPVQSAETLLNSDFSAAQPTEDVADLLGGNFGDLPSSNPQASKAKVSKPAEDHFDDFGSSAQNPQTAKNGDSKKPPVFAKNTEEPETNALAADVLALLQTTDNEEKVDISSRQERQLDNLKISVDTELLDNISTGEDESVGFTVFVRSPDMKPYRRNNAKYCCSACGNEFFTKEQVEACFYAHPEEGSEEARALIAKGMKLSRKSAA